MLASDRLRYATVFQPPGLEKLDFSTRCSCRGSFGREIGGRSRTPYLVGMSISVYLRGLGWQKNRFWCTCEGPAGRGIDFGAVGRALASPRAPQIPPIARLSERNRRQTPPVSVPRQLWARVLTTAIAPKSFWLPMTLLQVHRNPFDCQLPPPGCTETHPAAGNRLFYRPPPRR